MMGFSCIVHGCRVFVALLTLSVVVLAKIPTFKCTCHKKKTTSESRVECPFGKLRTLAGAMDVQAVTVFAIAIPQDPGQVVVQTYVSPAANPTVVIRHAREPPAGIHRSHTTT